MHDPKVIAFIVFLIFVIIFSIVFAYDLVNLLIRRVPSLSSNREILRKLKSEAVAKYIRDKKTFCELGSSYGRVLFFMCAEYGFEGFGYETNLWPYVYSFLYKRMYYPSVCAKIKWGSFYKHLSGDPDVIFCFLMPSIMGKIEKRLLPALKSGTVIISNSFKFKKMEPVEILEGEKGKIQTLYIYIV